MTSLPEPLAQLQEPPIFVVGVARSGTTWMGDIIGAHPAVASIFESWMFTRRGLKGPFVQKVWDPEFADRHAHRTGQRGGLEQLMTRAQLREDMRELSARWLGRALRPEHRFLVEKGPGDIALMHELYPEASFVHVIRDGRDVALSVRAAQPRFYPAFSTIGTSIADIAEWWAREVRSIRDALREAGARHMEIRYEEVKADPKRSYRRVFDFCAIPYDDALLDEVFATTDFDLLPREGDREFRRQGRAGSWRAELGARDAWAFARAGGEMLVELGYAPSRRWWVRHGLTRLTARF